MATSTWTADTAYMLCFEYNNGTVAMAMANGQLLVAREEDSDLLIGMGDDLLDRELILSYQLLRTAAPPVRRPR